MLSFLILFSFFFSSYCLSTSFHLARFHYLAHSTSAYFVCKGNKFACTKWKKPWKSKRQWTKFGSSGEALFLLLSCINNYSLKTQTLVFFPGQGNGATKRIVWSIWSSLQRKKRWKASQFFVIFFPCARLMLISS